MAFSRMPSLVPRRAAALACAAAGLILAWRIAAILVDDLSGADPLATAQTLAADPEKAEQAKALAARALLASPLESAALRILATVAQHRAEPDRAEALMREAGARWPFDQTAQVWLLNRALADGDYSKALHHIDILLRTRPHTGESLLPTLLALAGTEGAVEALADRLSAAPPWREWMLRELAKGSEDPLRPLALFTAMRARGSSASPAELTPFLQRLIDSGRAPEAYILWVQSLPAEELQHLGNVINPGFERPLAGVPFDWTIASPRGSAVRIADSPDGAEGRTLRLDFTGGRVAFRHVSQTLLLAPGDYRIAVRGRTEELRNERGLWWTLSCAAGPQLATTERISGSTPWTMLEMQVSIPAGGCEAQVLRLELAARVPLEQQVSGAAWFDDVQVTPSGAP
jgi:hypothetical protein